MTQFPPYRTEQERRIGPDATGAMWPWRFWLTCSWKHLPAGRHETLYFQTSQDRAVYEHSPHIQVVDTGEIQ